VLPPGAIVNYLDSVSQSSCLFDRHSQPRAACNLVEIVRLRAVGQTVGAIARELKVSKATVYRLLQVETRNA
jgi:DNA-binding NarL/FixJ family response regulator